MRCGTCNPADPRLPAPSNFHTLFRQGPPFHAQSTVWNSAVDQLNHRTSCSRIPQFVRKRLREMQVQVQTMTGPEKPGESLSHTGIDQHWVTRK